jgi:predicted glycoside hydrolase/deacetylase ChbG (UPF0249 family)
MLEARRFLVVTADDFGIGPATSQGILDLAVRRRVCATVLLVNSPHTEAAVKAWQQAGRPLEVGWHPCLTLDQPVSPPQRVPSLVDRDGRFWPLGPFLRRLHTGRIRFAEIEAELRAQFGRFRDLLGSAPASVNSHHHVQVFPPIGAILRGLFDRRKPLPYIRRIREPWRLLAQVPGARVKRLALSLLGRRDSRRQRCQGFPGNDWLAGITDPPWVADPQFFVRWLRRVPGRVVELTCHPGYLDPSLIGRDAWPSDGQLQRRVREWHLLQHAAFEHVCREAGFTLVAPSELLRVQARGQAHAA